MEPRRAQKVAECEAAVIATAAKLDAEDAADKAAGRWFW